MSFPIKLRGVLLLWLVRVGFVCVVAISSYRPMQALGVGLGIFLVIDSVGFIMRKSVKFLEFRKKERRG